MHMNKTALLIALCVLFTVRAEAHAVPEWSIVTDDDGGAP